MTTKINRHDQKIAFQAQAKLLPAIAALTAIDHNTTGPETLLAIKNLIGILTTESASNADKIDLAAKNFNERPVDLIAQAQHEFFQIIREIELIESNVRITGDNYLFQKKELEEKGFSAVQIEKIIQDPINCADDVRTRIEALKSEQHKLELFVNCHPDYDTDLLCGTRLEQSAAL